MEQLVDKHSEGPDISFGAVNVVNEAFRRHVDRRADVYILEFLSALMEEYFVNLAKPKSAILAWELCIKTFATLRSR